MKVHVERSAHVRGVVSVPGDKSKSHRAVLLAALADGPSRVVGVSRGADVAATVEIVRQLGATISDSPDALVITGPRDGLRASAQPLECENSGTTMRLLCGLLASVTGTHHLGGDASLSARPMDRVARPLSLMGVEVTGSGERVWPPLVVTSSGRARAISYDVPEPSAQVKSAILFAGLAADAPTVVREHVRTRTATEEMFARAGLAVTVSEEPDGRRIEVEPGRPSAQRWVVPGDPSQASFLLVAALLHPEGAVTVPDLDAGAERWGFARVLERMGAQMARTGDGDMVTVTARSSQLVGTDVDSSEIPSLDEVPVLAVAAAAAAGVTRFVGVGELRVKESDRLAGTVALVTGLGATATVDGDTLRITGVGGAGRFTRLAAEGRSDHRMVMAAAVAGVTGAGADIYNAQTVASSFPTFFDVLASVAT